jgi:hypothetical protein
MTLRTNYDDGGTAPLPGNLVASDLIAISKLLNNLSNSVSLHSNVVTSGTTQTVVLQLDLPANSLQVGSTFNVIAAAIDSVSANLTWQIHLGPLGTTADPVVCSVVQGTNGGATPSYNQGLVTIRSIGASGTAIGEILSNIIANAYISNQTATTTVATTADNKLTLSVAAASGTATVYVALIEQVI